MVESTVKLPKTFEERKQLGMAAVALNFRNIIWLKYQFPLTLKKIPMDFR